MLIQERSLSLGLHDQMRRICFNMEMVKIQIAQISEPSREQSGPQTLMLQGSQQAEIPRLPRTEDEFFEAPEVDLSLDTLAAAPRLSRPQFSGSDALARPYAATFDFIRNICEQDCSCTCHQGGRIRSPRYLSTILGSLLIGYTAQPGMTCVCNSYDCRGRSTCITYTYAFPRWLLDRMIACSIAYDRSRGPELCVRLLRVRSGHEYIFWVATMRTSDTDKTSIHHIKYLLTNGEASVLDVDPYGRTALQVSSKPFSLLDCTTDTTGSGLLARRIMTRPHF